MEPIVLGRPVVDGSRISVEIRAGAARRYLREGVFWVQYSGLDHLSEVDEGILVLPTLGTILTVAYALGVVVETHEVDAAYADASEELATVFGGMYPSFSTRGHALRGNRVVTSQAAGTGGVLLFSGGVDATSSLIEHRVEPGDLLTVWGADVQADNVKLWQQLKGTVLANEIASGWGHLMAQSNLVDVVDGLRLTEKFRNDFAGANWWAAAQHGMALTSLAIPAAAHQGRKLVYIAGSLMTDVAWGSTKDTDGRLRWSSGRVVHDQHDLSRQRKLADVIAPYVTSGGNVTLAVCYQTGRGGSQGLNCGYCEKCLRTVTGLLATGTPPEDLGLPLSAKSLKHAWRELARGAWHGDADHQATWAEIQVAIPTVLTGVQDKPAVREYLQWLGTASLDLRPPVSPAQWTTKVKCLASFRLRRVLRHVPFHVREFSNRRLTSCRSRLRLGLKK